MKCEPNMDYPVYSYKKDRQNCRISIDLAKHDWLRKKLKTLNPLPNETKSTEKLNYISTEVNSSKIITKSDCLPVPFPVQNSMDKNAMKIIATNISHALKNSAATVVENKPKNNTVATQTEDVTFVTKDDIEILQFMKSHAISKEVLSNIVQTINDDVNNQSEDEAHSRQAEEIEVIDENNNEGNDQLVIDTGVLNTLLNHSEKNKAIIYEQYGDVYKSNHDVNSNSNRTKINMKNKTEKVIVINETIQMLEKIVENILAPSPDLLDVNTQTETGNAIQNVMLSHDKGRESYFANLTQPEDVSVQINVQDMLNLHTQSRQLIQEQTSEYQQQNQSQSNSYHQRPKRQKQQHNKQQKQQNPIDRQSFQQRQNSQQPRVPNQSPPQRQSRKKNESSEYSSSTEMPQLQPMHPASPTWPHNVFPGNYPPTSRGMPIRPQDPLFFQRALQHLNATPGWSQNLPSNAVRTQFEQSGQQRQQLMEQAHQQQIDQQRQQLMDQQLQQQMEQQRQQQMAQQLQQQLEQRRQQQLDKQLQQQMAHQHQQQMDEQRKQQIIQQRQQQRRSEQQNNSQTDSQLSVWEAQLLQCNSSRTQPVRQTTTF